MKRCPNCPFVTFEDRHLCPDCGTPLQDTPAPAALDEAQEAQILKKLRRQVYRVFLGELSVVAIISLIGLVFGLWKAYSAAVEKLETIVIQRVTAQFEEPNIQKTVQSVAGNEAAKIISQNVEPAEQKVDMRLKNFEKFLDERKAEYDADLSTFKKELDVLKKRNELARMADRAIAEGSLVDYQRLEQMLNQETDEDLKAAESAEVFRVVSAFSPLSPSRSGAAKFVMSKVNPTKKDEKDLSDDELLAILQQNQDGLARAHAASLLQGRTMTFRIAQALRDAIDKETHLEALRFEKGAFDRISGFDRSGHIDGSEEVKWFDENVDRLRKELPK